MKKIYNIEDLKKDLIDFDYEEYKELPNDKAYRIYNSLYNSTTQLIVHERSITGALAQYLGNASYDSNAQKSIDLGFFGRNYNQKYLYNTANDIYAVEVSKEETAQIYENLKSLVNFNKLYSKKYYYMIEYGNGYTEEQASAYNFLQIYLRCKNTPIIYNINPNYKKYVKLINEIYPFLFSFVQNNIKREKTARNNQKKFIDAFTTIFENNLNFNIDLNLDNEKPGGLNEQRAYCIIDNIKSYNEFNISIFADIINYLNKNFIKYYGKGNPNNYTKDYTIFFGRENSPVMYIITHFKTESAIDNTLKELQKISGADEASITKKCECYDDCIAATLRLWWD